MSTVIKSVVLDVDGVIVQGEHFGHSIERDYGIDGTLMVPFFKGVFMDCLVGKKDVREELPPYLKQWGWNGSVDDFMRYWHQTEHRIDQDLIAHIQRLRKQGIICAVGTNQDKHRLAYLLKQMGFADSFDHVFASSMFGHMKPYIHYFDRVLKELQVEDPGEVLFFDDRAENIEAAKSVGMRAEVYTTYEQFKQQLSAYALFHT